MTDELNPIVVDVEVEEISQLLDMEVSDQIIVNPAYVKLGEKDFEINQTSTSATSIGAFYVDPASDLWRSDCIILISVRDKAGKRNGHFFGTDFFFANPIPANGGADANLVNTSAARVLYRVDSNGKSEVYSSNTSYGVYGYDINNEGRIRVYARYNSTYTYTIDGTFKVEVWALKFPNNVSPFA